MKYIIKFAVVLMVVGLLASCEDFLDVNVDPNNPTSVTPDLVLGPAQYYTDAVNLKSWDYSTNKIQAIITRKWIAVNGITAEQSWFDYNRTGYPSGIPIPLNYTATTDRPVRLAYPSSEYSSNGDNVPTQPNVFTVKIFWAQ